MKSLNDTLKEISMLQILIIAVVALFAIIFLEDILEVTLPQEIINLILVLFIAYKLRGCGRSFKLEIHDVFTDFPFKFLFLVVILNIFFSYGMIYVSDILIAFFPYLANITYCVATANANIVFAGSLISSIIIAPVSEELVFRGVILNRLNRRVSLTAAILISSFLFGICHDFGGMFSAFVFGICMCILYLKTSNIFVPMLAHGLNNLLSEIIAFIDIDGIIFTDTIVICIFCILAIISAFILFVSIRAEWKNFS